MNYIQFNNKILINDGDTVRTIEKGAFPDHYLLSIDTASVCVVDVDVLIAASVEFPVEKKDSILVRKFKELYQYESYVIQDEKIDNNLFQVIGVKEQLVREVNSLIGSEKIETFVPYPIALRNALMNKKVNLTNIIVFVDDIGSERLLTVFDGLKFSRTRVIPNNGEDILPEIKRSQIDFFKKTEEFLSKKNADFSILVNNKTLVNELSKSTEKLQIQYVNIPYPGLEGLKDIDTLIKYRLPEEEIKKKKEIELRNKIRTLIFSICVVLAGFFYFLFNKVQIELVSKQCDLANQIHAQLEEKIKVLDKETYHEALKTRKTLNYGITYLSILEIIPSSYTVNSFKFYKTDKWNLEMTLFTERDGVYDQIPCIKILKDAEIRDIFYNNQPGKHLRVTL